MKITNPHYAQLRALIQEDITQRTTSLGIIRQRADSREQQAGIDLIRARLIAACHPGIPVRAGIAA